ncbi:MAG: type VI secretion system Vgr family protein [Crocinitomicaceae bacterium]
MEKKKTTISIDGKDVSIFERVKLSQGINDHHRFEVIFDMEIVETMKSHTINASKEWLGRSIMITFGEVEFLGVISDVRMLHRDGFHGMINVSGYSKTILLEAGPHMQSWLDKRLDSIVKDVVEEAGVEAEVSPAYTAIFDYQAQYNESHYEFLQRLARQHNEWLFYDGTKLVFGKPSSLGKPVEIVYGIDMDSIGISIESRPNKQRRFTYNSSDDDHNESSAKGAVEGLNELGNHAFNSAKELYKIIPNAFSAARVKDRDQIDKVLSGRQASIASTSNVLRGTSQMKGLTVGTVIKVTAALIDDGTKNIDNHGEYIITNISHSDTGLEDYNNEFEAIAANVMYLPAPNVHMPIAQPQVAKVLSNADPKSMGRVKVQFQWQKGESKTAWIRVMTPDAGVSDLIGENRGFVHIPEVGDTVMVGFRYSDPNRPFVMGSMFNGSTGAGGGVDNNIKTTITRSGHTIKFDDTERRESITITDKNKNIIFIDTANSSIHMTAPEHFTISAKNIDITASENLSMTAGKNMGISAGDDMNINAGDNMNQIANEDFSILAKNIMEQASENFESLAVSIQEHAETVMKASAKEDMELNSSGTINNNSGNKVKLF